MLDCLFGKKMKDEILTTKEIEICKERDCKYWRKWSIALDKDGDITNFAWNKSQSKKGRITISCIVPCTYCKRLEYDFYDKLI